MKAAQRTGEQKQAEIVFSASQKVSAEESFVSQTSADKWKISSREKRDGANKLKLNMLHKRERGAESKTAEEERRECVKDGKRRHRFHKRPTPDGLGCRGSKSAVSLETICVCRRWFRWIQR